LEKRDSGGFLSSEYFHQIPHSLFQRGLRSVGVKLRDRSKENTWGKSPIPLKTWGKSPILLKIMNACFSIGVSWEKVNVSP
jgi:hypothetical protein